jgi:hypothetical protein
MLIDCGTNGSWGLIWEAERKNGGPCIGHSGITKRSRGRSRSSRVYRFRIPRVRSRLAVHMCAVLSGDKRSPISPSLFGRKYSVRMEFGMSSNSYLCMVGPVATRRMHDRVISQERPFKPTISFVGIKKRSRKSNKSCKAAALSPLLSPL